jgi:hypothetical protein
VFLIRPLVKSWGTKLGQYKKITVSNIRQHGVEWNHSSVVSWIDTASYFNGIQDNLSAETKSIWTKRGLPLKGVRSSTTPWLLWIAAKDAIYFELLQVSCKYLFISRTEVVNPPTKSFPVSIYMWSRIFR